VSLTIPVAVVDDDSRMRDLLRLLLDGSPGYRCAAAFGSVEEALAGMPAPPPEIALLDVHLPGLSGSTGVGLLRERFPELQVLMLTVYAEDDLVFEAICNGAAGYLLKRTPPAALLAAISEAHQGGAPMSPEIARKVLRVFRGLRPARREEPGDPTPRELRLLSLLAEGHGYESIGARLDVTVDAVRIAVRGIYRRLQGPGMSEAVSKAIGAGLI